jgi:hypothetical protein
MYRGILIAFLAGAILVAFAAVPPMLPGSTIMSRFGSAQAQQSTPTTDSINLNSSRSNRTKKAEKRPKQQPTPVQGTTIQHCSNGDPLEGLNVGGKPGTGGCVPF